jgi:hypothetical protein
MPAICDIHNNLVAALISFVGVAGMQPAADLI